jgi:hypothetical protein
LSGVSSGFSYTKETTALKNINNNISSSTQEMNICSQYGGTRL